MKTNLAVAGLLSVAGIARALTLESGPARMTVDADTGAIASISAVRTDDPIFRGGEDGAWRLKFRAGADLVASPFRAAFGSRRPA